MKAEYVNPFPQGVVHVLKQLGLEDVQRTALNVQQEMASSEDVIAFIGLVGELSGNVSYCFSQETARKLAAQMIGSEVDSMDELTRSALAELANMFAAHAVTALQSAIQGVEPTTPSVVAGQDMHFILNFHDTLMVSLDTPVGPIQVNISIEV